ncbi:hypothetical protein POHY109586_24300 [Polaromonas hydrogenivorans]
MQIVSMTGLSYPAVRSCIDLFVEGGWPAIRPALRGRSQGLGRTLSQDQEDSLQRSIIDQRPEQFKMDFFLWSRTAVGQLIEQEYVPRIGQNEPAACGNSRCHECRADHGMAYRPASGENTNIAFRPTGNMIHQFANSIPEFWIRKESVHSQGVPRVPYCDARLDRRKAIRHDAGHEVDGKVRE